VGFDSPSVVRVDGGSKEAFSIMPALRIMVQGTGSYVGKSVLTAALCRYFYRQGYRVAPFKSQNMSNNSFVTPDGGEIGRAQAFQAAACGIEPAVEMNPVLLKPSSDLGSQVVVLGKAVGHMRVHEYHAYQKQLRPVVSQAFEKLAESYDVVVLEGAGSPAEINLRRFDIVNMAMARMANAPVVLVGDIHLGGVFAWLVGTMELLEPEERARVKGFIINKFRGDASLLTDGIVALEARTKTKTLGVIPFVPNLPVDEEDGVKTKPVHNTPGTNAKQLKLVVVRFPRISNSTDFECFLAEPDVSLDYISAPPPIEDTPPDAVFLPGTKSTMKDLNFLRSSGLVEYLRAAREKAVPVIGICGGFQMLGRRIVDHDAVESDTPAQEGLGFLNVETSFAARKQTVRVRGVSLQSGKEIGGYEIHMGQTERGQHTQPWLRITNEQGTATERYDGCISEDGNVAGTYVHGLFDAPGFRRDFLNRLRLRLGWEPLAEQLVPGREATLNSLAELVRNHLDCRLLDDILKEKL
jgi:adenosylcobyric acid synthase